MSEGGTGLLRLTRRRLLAVAAAAGLTAAGGLNWFRGRRRDTGADRLVTLFRKHFNYLDLDEQGLRRFFADYQRVHRSLLASDGTPRRRLPYLSFLESTDFFVHGADESRTVHYVMLRDPYENPCFNPFAAEESPHGRPWARSMAGEASGAAKQGGLRGATRPDVTTSRGISA